MDQDMTLTSEQQPSAADVAVVQAGLLAFNVQHLGLEPRTGAVNIFLRDRSGQIIGRLLGGWRWGWLYVDKLWIEEAHRQRGGGSRLLAAAEAEAIAAGCTDAVVDTFSFQAPGFYERHGYETYATLQGFPPGYRQLYFHKKLVDSQR